MADPRFFSVSGPFTLKELARSAEAEIGAGDPEKIFDDVAPLDKAKESNVSFLDNRKYVEQFTKTNAGACIVRPDMASKAPEGMALLLSQDPYRGYARIAKAFYPETSQNPSIHPSAQVEASAKIGQGCVVGPGAVIGPEVEISDNCRIGANTVIGRGVVLGNDCRIGPLVTLECCLIGERAIIHTGARIGQDGFGFAMGKDGHLKVPQLGRVVIGDDVEIGANTTIDRGTAPDTEIGSGTKIDNLVQIGHNVKTGINCVLASLVGVSGSTEIGNFVAMGGQAGVAGHLKIGDGAQLAGRAGVMRDIPPGVTVGGIPAVPMRQWLRQAAILEQMAKKKKGS
jgi:UDP-3-O-[3-hydroxymyristoyl] glucosamine N-acyltransferase